MSHSILDDFDFDVQSIRLHTPYVTKNPKFLGLTTTNSTIAASEALNHVLFDVDKQIENIILESKLPGVSVNFLSNILNLIVLVETNEPANHPSTISPDEEPVNSPLVFSCLISLPVARQRRYLGEISTECS